jgi:hypothetical protein
MTDKWIFEPYIGVGPIKFGMSITEVEKILGKPWKTIQRTGWKLRENRENLAIIYSKENSTVDEISCWPELEVFYHGRDIMQNDILAYLKNFDNEPYESTEGSIIFFRLGLVTGGYHDNDESQKNVTFFKKGLWDDIRDELKLYTSTVSI